MIGEPEVPVLGSGDHARPVTHPTDGHLWVAPPPSFPDYPRACVVADVPDTALPAIPHYVCRRARAPITIDGRLDAGEWEAVTWSERFGRIGDGLLDGLDTRIGLLWDEDHLYAAYQVQDTDIRGTLSGHHDHVYRLDDDVEVFVEGPDGYFEFGVNPINTVYEIKWAWLESLISSRNYAELDRYLRVPDTLYYAPRSGENYGRLADLQFELPGIRHAVQIDGVLNNPRIQDVGWTVEVALPWAGLAEIGLPRPEAGLGFRVQGYRALHTGKGEPREPGRFGRPASLTTPSVGYTWSTMGNGNVHNPERWVSVVLGED